MAITKTLSTASSTAKSLVEALSTTRSQLGSSPEASQALMEVQSLVLSLQSSLLEIQAQVLELQEANRELDAKVQDRDAEQSQKARYQRRKVGQSWVMVRAGDPAGAYYCPTCVDNGHEVLIQPHPMPLGTSGTHACPFCGVDFRL
ncbi:MAG: hypothetical protein AAF560_13080 [Acidobacteriota bacterium]